MTERTGRGNQATYRLIFAEKNIENRRNKMGARKFGHDLWTEEQMIDMNWNATQALKGERAKSIRRELRRRKTQ